ncbi:hypothetical protein [Pseudactinotalea terrae]|uniref:hypothetical protein n=1 Tax=Pseudactinotalea terrae TaxID=1743262 RepID=UPI0012E2BD0F|nr:hypothetical protein [Pseudactinotalea terrae]
MTVHNEGTGGRWSSLIVVRALALVIVVLIAAAGLAVAALTSEGGRELPVEHGVEQPSIQ